ncbi:hypothetical protein GCM10023083_44060 [Streptomyces phyllanthi]
MVETVRAKPNSVARAQGLSDGSGPDGPREVPCQASRTRPTACPARPDWFPALPRPRRTPPSPKARSRHEDAWPRRASEPTGPREARWAPDAGQGQ